MKGQISNK